MCRSLMYFTNSLIFILSYVMARKSDEVRTLLIVLFLPQYADASCVEKRVYQNIEF